MHFFWSHYKSLYLEFYWKGGGRAPRPPPPLDPPLSNLHVHMNINQLPTESHHHHHYTPFNMVKMPINTPHICILKNDMVTFWLFHWVLFNWSIPIYSTTCHSGHIYKDVTCVKRTLIQWGTANHSISTRNGHLCTLSNQDTCLTRTSPADTVGCPD